MFLYQLVNLVLETCLIFSKTLKLSKTYLSWISRQVRSVEQRALWYSYSRLSFWNSFQEGVVSWIFGIFTKSIMVSILDFWHISFRKMFELLTCKKKSWLVGFRCHVVNRLEVDRHGWGLLLSLAMFEEKSLFKVGCHVGNVTWLSLPFF